QGRQGVARGGLPGAEPDTLHTGMCGQRLIARSGDDSLTPPGLKSRSDYRESQGNTALPPADLILNGQYDPRLVALSCVIAVFASFASLNLAGRIRSSSGSARLLWL